MPIDLPTNPALDLPPDFASCAAAILAGGRGARFGGDKPLAPFRGSTLLGHLLAQLDRLGFAQQLVAAKEPGQLREQLDARPAQFIAMPNIGTPTKAVDRVTSIDWIADASSSFNPLAGLVAALRAARTEWVFACAADMPFAADRTLLEALFHAAAGRSAVVPTHAGTVQPLCALWRRDRCLPLAESLLSSGNAGPRALLLQLGASQLEWADPKPFLDADTREALAQIESSEH